MAPGRLPWRRQPTAVIKAMMAHSISIQGDWRGHITHEPVATSDRGTSSKTERGKGNERGGVQKEGITCPTNRSLGHCSNG